MTRGGRPSWRKLGATFVTAGEGSLTRYAFGIYRTPAGSGKTVSAGPGRSVPAGTGKEHWTTYDVTDGLGYGQVSAILQDDDGYLWFATPGGVSRFDGEGFRTFTTQDGLASNRVSSMLQDRDGYLWVGTWGGSVSRYDGETWRTYSTDDGLPQNNVVLCCRIGKGTSGSARRAVESVVTMVRSGRRFTVEDGLADDAVRSVLQDPEGNLWIGTWGGGVSRYDGETWRTYSTEEWTTT